MIQPQPKRLVVLAIDEETEHNGIILTTKKQTKHILGKVVALGEDCKNIKIDDTVVFSKIGIHNYEEYLIIDYDNILGVLKD